jgi:hypothetical protein
MSDSKHSPRDGEIRDGEIRDGETVTTEPARDVKLGAILRDAVGEAPLDAVDWTALALRIGDAAAAQAPWWSYAARWERRVVPLALAAGLLGAVALWSTAPRAYGATPSAPDLIAAVLTGTPPADAATSFAHSVTSSVDISSGVRE